jgi:O-methyltransferase involved in polyketide biosynthesis
VFEVDDPPIQIWKQARLKTLGLEAPPQLRFAPCDFERDSIANALAAAGRARSACVHFLARRHPISVGDLCRRLRSLGSRL